MAGNLKWAPAASAIEFVVQLLQLIRGGREPSLRERGLLPALTACEQLGALSSTSAQRLREAYRFLRRIENRVQMLRDEQTHDVPEDDLVRARLATALGSPGWSVLAAELARIRASVSEEFGNLRAPPTPAKRMSAGAAAVYWKRLTSGDAQAAELAGLGFATAEHLHAQLAALRTSPAANALSAHAQGRFERLLPHLLDAAVATAAPDACIERLLRLLHAVMRRPAYLALLEEQPLARERLVTLFADSALLAERVIAHPLLLDDLLTAHADAAPPDRSTLSAEIERRIAQAMLLTLKRRSKSAGRKTQRGIPIGRLSRRARCHYHGARLGGAGKRWSRRRWRWPARSGADARSTQRACRRRLRQSRRRNGASPRPGSGVRPRQRVGTARKRRRAAA